MKMNRGWAMGLASLTALAACGVPEVSLFPVEDYPEVDEYEAQMKEELNAYAKEGEKYRIPVDKALASVAGDPSKLDPLVQLENDLGELSQVERGKRHFEITYACAACHAFNGERKVGPPLNNRWGGKAPLEGGEVVAFNDEYFRESVLYSKKKIARGYAPVMPVFEGQMSDEDFEDIKAYVMTHQ